jgi:adenylylsulfate kinase
MPWVVWITGLPGSGKSTIAEALKERVGDVVILNMDELRGIVTPEPSYSDSERDYVYRAIVYTAKKLHEAGHNVIIDATGNRRRWRELARSIIPEFFEVYLKCPVETCIKRERQRIETHGAPKDIYKKAEAGWPVPGKTVPYEEPVKPELIIHTDRDHPDETVKRIIRMVSGKR